MSEFMDQLQAALEGRYTIDCEISSGAMASVYRALDLKHARAVAIKALHPEYLGAMEGDRFLREIRMLARLQHPHILPLFDSGEAAGGLYYVMPFVEGESLRERLRQMQHFGVAEAVTLAREVCDALAYAHLHDVLHRDIKPENIMLGGGHALVVDFGVARAIHVATAGEATTAGIVPGTPAYMSPEQASGDQALTERSDIYSLGCVLYEMLAGSPPHAASSNRATLVARLTTPPRDLRELRPDVSPSVAAVVHRALALDPLQRYANAKELSDALEAAVTTPARPEHTRRWRLFGAAVIATVAVAVAAAMRFGFGGGTSPDPSVFVVLPFASVSTDGVGADGADLAQLVTDAVARWRGVRLADDMRVRDLVARRRRVPYTLTDARAAARTLGAGRLIWGSVERAPAGLSVRLAVFNSHGSAEAVARAQRVLAPDAVSVDSVTAMTDDMLTQLAAGGRDTRMVGTRDALALQSYLQGHAALSRFELDSAAAFFAGASVRDSTFALALYWAAQTRAWRLSQNESPDWELLAARAMSLGASLSDRQRKLTIALLALARGQYQAACEEYSALLARDSLDFEGWFGRGECLARDRVVVRDRSSASGWRFRSSAHAAVSAYRRSLQLAPSFLAGVAVSRLEALLMATPNAVATGASAGDSAGFAAYPGLAGDTLALVPWPAEDLFAGKPGTRPATYVAAIDRNREALRNITARFARENPGLAVARAHHALALENLATIDTLGRSESAFREILDARALAHTRRDSVQFAAVQLRLLLKLGQSDAAKALADSMLRWSEGSAGTDAKALASAAMLTGRLALAVRLLRTSARDERLWTPRGRIPFPMSIADPALELSVYAAAGAPADVVAPMIDRTDRAIDAWARADLTPSLRAMMLYVPAALAFPATGITRAHARWHDADRYLALQYLFAQRQIASVRSALAALVAETAEDRPGDAGTEYTLIEVLARLSVGDSTTARDLLETALGSLPNAGRILTEEVTSVGALARLWMLQAELASRRGDRASAVRSAHHVATLWRDADPIMRPVVERASVLTEAQR